MSNVKSEFKEEVLPLELQAGHMHHHLRCPIIQVVMQESLKMT